jgi:hypothetical protein
MDRVVLVTKTSRLEELVLHHLTEGAARFVLESQGESIDPYKREHDAYRLALAEVRQQIPNDLPVATVTRQELPTFLFRDKDLVIACGPDGLFANLAKYVGDQPVLTVNPDPETVAGALMLFPPAAVGQMIARVQENTHRIERLPFIKASIDVDRAVWGINDVFLGRIDHVSARYEVSFRDRKERHSSSGIIVSTGVGATGWMRSIAVMAAALARGGSPALARLPPAASNELVFVVREPFPSPTTGTSIVTGRIMPGVPLIATSEMPAGGYIFSDGVIEKAVEWKAGSKVTVSVGDRYVQRIVK